MRRSLHRTHSIKYAAVIFAIAALGTFWLFQGRLINHDTAWFLIAIERWMNGAELYRAIIETNPPLNFYYTLPAYGIAQLTGASLSDAQYAVTSLMTGGVLAWSYLMFVARDRSRHSRQIIFVLLLWAAAVLPSLRHFTQREHLLVLFLMPWVVGLVFDKNGANGRGGAIRGGFAALGICLKPHFLVFPIFTTVALVVRDRSLRPLWAASNISIILVGAGYVGCVWMAYPAYFTEIAPKALLTYEAYGESDLGVIINIGLLQILFLTLLLLECLRQRFIPGGIGLLVALVLAAIASYTLQWKGFKYHPVPIHSFGVMVCAFVILRSAVKPVQRSAVLCLLVIFGLSLKSGFYQSRSVLALSEQLRKGPAENGITVLSSHVYVGPIVALELGVPWHNRYPALWTVPGIANAKAEADCTQSVVVCDTLRAMAAETRANVLADLQTGRPDAIVFDKKAGYFDEPGFSYEAFLRRSEELSDFFDGYTQRVSTSRFDILYR